MSMLQAGLIDMRSIKPGFIKFGVVEFGIFEECTSEIRITHVDSYQVGSSEIPSAQLRASEVNPHFWMLLPPAIPLLHTFLSEHFKQFFLRPLLALLPGSLAHSYIVLLTNCLPCLSTYWSGRRSRSSGTRLVSTICFCRLSTWFRLRSSGTRLVSTICFRRLSTWFRSRSSGARLVHT